MSPGQTLCFVAQRGTSRFSGEIRRYLDTGQIRPYDPPAARTQSRGDGRADAGRRPRDESGAGQTSSLSLNLSTLPDEFIGSSSTKVTPRGTL